MKIIIFFVVVITCTTIFLLKYHKPIYNKYFCPNAESLAEGFIYTDSVGKMDFNRGIRRLEGPFIAKEGLLSNSISYAGLFTHKYWENGGIIQYEEPLSDMSELLKFEIGKEYEIKTIRYNPQKPDHKWYQTSNYTIERSKELILGWCSYSALIIDINKTITYPDGNVKTNNEKITFIPELMLITDTSDIYSVNVTKVRAKRDSDRNWAFTSDANTWLHK